MTGKSNSFKKDKDENEDEEWPAIFRPIYDLRMKQLTAKDIRDKANKKAKENEFSSD